MSYVIVDECVYDHSLLKLPVCNATDSASSMAEWETLNREQIIMSFFSLSYATYGRLTYHAVASSKLYANPFALRFDGMQFQKITEE
uniref:PKD_channel domain-containing protein n=1 Tax=Heterorhabditis bacteriophora TaxID=37862 RepID=A0A1I7XAT1_HETBA